jgi:putative transposase
MRPKARERSSEHSRQKPRAEGPNHFWSLDFGADELAGGRRFWALTVVDVYTRECLAIEVGQSLKGYDVVRVLQQVADQRGMPRMLF